MIYLHSLSRMRNFYCLVISVFTIGCSPVYVPNARQATLFEKKGDFKASAYALQVADVQVAYAVSNHLAVLANGATNLTKDFPSFKFGELGVGYFTKAKEFNIEFFGGYGLGTSISDFNNKLVSGDYYRIFISQAAGQKLDRFQWSFINRFSLVDFKNFQPTDPLMSRSPKIFVEPGFHTAYSIIKDKFNFALQAGCAVHLGSQPYFDYSPFYFSCGFNYQIYH